MPRVVQDLRALKSEDKVSAPPPRQGDDNPRISHHRSSFGYHREGETWNKYYMISYRIRISRQILRRHTQYSYISDIISSLNIRTLKNRKVKLC